MDENLNRTTVFNSGDIAIVRIHFLVHDDIRENLTIGCTFKTDPRPVPSGKLAIGEKFAGGRGFQPAVRNPGLWRSGAAAIATGMEHHVYFWLKEENKNR